MSRYFLAYAISSFVHVGVLAWMSAGMTSLPEMLAVERGRASIQLQASIASRQQSEPEETWTKLRVEAPRKVVREEEPRERPEFELARESHDLTLLAVRDEGLPPPTVEVQEREIELALIEPSQSTPAPRKVEITRKQPRPKVELEAVVESEVDSVASAASLAREGSEADEMPQKHPSNPAPTYPPEAMAAGHEGTVVLRAVIGATGRIESLALERTSGIASLDAAARAAVSRWRFLPARRGGLAIAYEVLIPVRFSIRGG